MNTVLWQANGGDSHYAHGWGLSIVFHGIAIGVTIALLSDLHLATRPDPFHWQVSVVGAMNPSAVQETTAAPMVPPASPGPVAPSVHATAPATTEAVSPQSMTPAVTSTLPRPTATRREQSGEKQNRFTPAIGSSEVLPPVPAPADPQSAPFTTATSSSMMSPPVEHRPPSSSSEPAPSSALPAPASSDEETAVSPAHAVARVPLETPPAVASISDARSNSGPSRNPSPIQDVQIGKPDFSWLTDSLRNRVQQSQKYSTVARLNGLEGRVVLRITVKDNGELHVAVATSSGHAILDQDAVEQVTHLSPLPLLQPLGRAQKVLNLPIIYTLNR